MSMEQAITPVTAGAGWITGKTTVANHSQFTARKKAVPKSPKSAPMSKRIVRTTKIGTSFHCAVNIIVRRGARWRLAIQSLLCLQTPVKLVVKGTWIADIKKVEIINQ